MEERDKLFLNQLEELKSEILKKYQQAENLAMIAARHADLHPETTMWEKEKTYSIERLNNLIKDLEEHHTTEDLRKFKIKWDEEMLHLSDVNNHLQDLSSAFTPENFWHDMIQFDGEIEEFLKKSDLLNQEEKSKVDKQPKEGGINDDKKQEKEVQEPKKEDIEKQAKPEELKPKNDNEQEQKTEGEKKPNEHEQKTKDVKPESQIEKDSKEAKKDKEKSVEEKTKEQQKLSPEQAMKDIMSKLEQYEESYKRNGSALNNDTYNAWMDFTKSLRYAVKNNLLSEDQVKQVKDIHDDMRFHSINSDAQYAGIEKFKKLFNEEKSQSNSVKEDIVKQQPNQERQPKEGGIKDDKKQEKEVQEPKKEDIEKQAKPEELKPKNDNEHKQENTEKSVEEKTKEQQKPTKTSDTLDIINNFIRTYNDYYKSGDFGSATYELDKLYKYLADARREGLISNGLYKEYRDTANKIVMDPNNAELQNEVVPQLYAISDRQTKRQKPNQEHQPKEELNKTAPEQQKANADNSVKNNFNMGQKQEKTDAQEKDIRNPNAPQVQKDGLEDKEIRFDTKESEMQKNPENNSVKDNFNMGQKQEKTDAQEKDIRNPNATWVQNNTLGDTEVRFNVKDSGLQQKREDLNPNINHEINPDINYKINDHNGNDVRQEPVTTQKKPTVKDFNVGTQNALNLIQQQENTAKLREAKNNVPNNQPIDRDTMNNIAAWRLEVLRQNR